MTAYMVDIVVPWCEHPTRCPKRAEREVFNQVNAGLGKFCPRHAEMALQAAEARERARYERGVR